MSDWSHWSHWTRQVTIKKTPFGIQELCSSGCQPWWVELRHQWVFWMGKEIMMWLVLCFIFLPHLLWIAVLSIGASSCFVRLGCFIGMGGWGWWCYHHAYRECLAARGQNWHDHGISWVTWKILSVTLGSSCKTTHSLNYYVHWQLCGFKKEQNFRSSWTCL